MRKANILKSEQAQVLVIFAAAVSMLLLFTGLAIDSGILYVNKSKLSAAVDGACLAGMKSLAAYSNDDQKITKATAVATDIFNANWGTNPPVPNITFPITAGGNQQVAVAASVSVHTLFMQLLPRFTFITVNANAVATRGRLIMTIVLDRSGSMASDGGQAGLQVAVPEFVNSFDNTANGDQVGMVSFSSNATINFPINHAFQSPIDSDVASMNFTGGTFGTGAGTGSLLSTTTGPPLSLAGAQNDGVSIPSGATNVVKVIVYFTDGLMNAVQDNFHCHGTRDNNLTLLNYGGFDSPGTGTYGDILDPTSATNIFGTASSSSIPYDSGGDTCVDATGHNVTKFTSQQPGVGNVSFLQTNITAEAKYRAKQTAWALESESQYPNLVYTIGLGSGVNSATQLLLKEIANDPGADTYTTTRTTGQFFYIPDCPSTPSSICTNEVRQVFQTIAAKVLLRLTQ